MSLYKALIRLSDALGYWTLDAVPVQPLKLVSLGLAGYVVITHFRPLAHAKLTDISIITVTSIFFTLSSSTRFHPHPHIHIVL